MLWLVISLHEYFPLTAILVQDIGPGQSSNYFDHLHIINCGSLQYELVYKMISRLFGLSGLPALCSGPEWAKSGLFSVGQIPSTSSSIYFRSLLPNVPFRPHPCPAAISRGNISQDLAPTKYGISQVIAIMWPVPSVPEVFVFIQSHKNHFYFYIFHSITNKVRSSYSVQEYESMKPQQAYLLEHTPFQSPSLNLYLSIEITFVCLSGQCVIPFYIPSTSFILLLCLALSFLFHRLVWAGQR